MILMWGWSIPAHLREDHLFRDRSALSERQESLVVRSKGLPANSACCLISKSPHRITGSVLAAERRKTAWG
jgi:hypothetical protein